MARTRLLLSILFCCLVLPGTALCEAPKWYSKLSPQWGGHLKIRGQVSQVPDDSLYSLVDSGTWVDGYTEARIKNKLYFGNWGILETHYEAIFYGGDTRKANQDLAKLAPRMASELAMAGPISDDSRFMNLTWVVDSDDEWILYNRLDRLFLDIEPSWGSIKLGRQALTWGHGLVFNPMDLLNPFAPTDIDRDYKIGDDMALVDVPIGSGALQGVLVPRRNPMTGSLLWDQSALGGKYRHSFGGVQVDFVAAKDYRDYVGGLGAVGYIGSAAWRCDVTYTWLDEKTPSGQTGFVAMVANMDYSWVWAKKNWYGLVEFYYNGLGDNDYQEALEDPALMSRLVRGQMFTLGETYLSAALQWEVTPLVNLWATVINNLADPSGIVMPRVVWNATQNTEVTLGGTLYYGGDDTEFGGFTIPQTGNLQYVSPPQAFLWFTWFF